MAYQMWCLVWNFLKTITLPSVHFQVNEVQEALPVVIGHHTGHLLLLRQDFLLGQVSPQTMNCFVETGAKDVIPLIEDDLTLPVCPTALLGDDPQSDFDTPPQKSEDVTFHFASLMRARRTLARA